MYVSPKEGLSEVYGLNEEESKYLKKFSRMSKEEQNRILNDPRLEKFDFINRKNPKIRDVVFIYNILEKR